MYVSVSLSLLQKKKKTKNSCIVHAVHSDWNIYIRRCLFEFLVTLLFVSVSRAVAKRLGAKLKGTLHAKRWHFFALTHEYRFIRSSEVCLYIDGQQTDSQALQYLKFDKVLPQACSLSLCVCCTVISIRLFRFPNLYMYIYFVSALCISLPCAVFHLLCDCLIRRI
jgi:hypothetical protein